MSRKAIKNAKIIDGSSSSWFWGSLLIEKGEITEIISGRRAEKLSSRYNFTSTDEVIDAQGDFLAPGFIDIHTHSDLTLLAQGKAASKVQQGVTTEVIGNCGSSPAPYGETDKETIKTELADYGLELTWRTFPEFLSILAQKKTSVNIVPLLGLGAVRSAVGGYSNQELSGKELKEAKEIIADAMEAGARGVSSGLIYPPSSYSNTAELISLAKVASAYGGLYATHLRNEGCDLVAALKEALTIGEQAEIPVQISHHKVSEKSCWGLVAGTIKMMENARQRGIDVTCDLYPYLASNTGLASLIPDWAHEGGKEKLLKRLKEPTARDKVLTSLAETGENRGWDKIMVSHLAGGAHQKFAGSYISEIAQSWKVSGAEAVIKILQDNELRAGMISFAMCEEDLIEVLTSRLSMIGSDGSSLAREGILAKGQPHPRNFGTFARVLGKYVRDKKILPLEEAIHKMTGKPAARLGLAQRGIIKPGNKADLVLFSAEEINDKATFKEPFQYPEGIKRVMVAGENVVKDKEHQRVYPGELIRA